MSGDGGESAGWTPAPHTRPPPQLSPPPPARARALHLASPTVEDLANEHPLDVQSSVTAERWVRKLRDLFAHNDRPQPIVLFFLTYPPPGFNNVQSFRSVWTDPAKARSMRRVMWDHYLNTAQIMHFYGYPYVTVQSVLWPDGPDEVGRGGGGLGGRAFA